MNKNSVLRTQIFSICDDQEKKLFKQAEKYFGGIDEVALRLAECPLKGVGGTIKFSDVRNVAASSKATIHPNYLKSFKNAYLKYLLKLLFNEKQLDNKIAEKYEIINVGKLNPNWDWIDKK